MTRTRRPGPRIGSLVAILVVWATLSAIADYPGVSPFDPGSDPKNWPPQINGPIWIPAGVESLRVCKLPPGRYWLSIRAVDSLGRISEPTRIEFDVGLASGFHRENVPPRFSVFPNPARDAINIEASFSGVLELFDIRGRSVLRAPFIEGRIRIPLGEIPSGVYYYRTSPKGIRGKIVRLR